MRLSMGIRNHLQRRTTARLVTSPASVGGGETASSPSGWTTDTLAAHMGVRMADMASRLDERFLGQQRAVDLAFAAQTVAMQTALASAEKAVTAALAAAEKAVDKAEIAAQKRFEAVNEFRAQLADQAASFMPRTESEATALRNVERVQEIQVALVRLISRDEVLVIADRNLNLISELRDRFNRMEGRDTGMSSAMGYVIAAIGLVGTIIAIVAAVIAFSNARQIDSTTTGTIMPTGMRTAMADHALDAQANAFRGATDADHTSDADIAAMLAAGELRDTTAEPCVSVNDYEAQRWDAGRTGPKTLDEAKAVLAARVADPTAPDDDPTAYDEAT